MSECHSHSSFMNEGSGPSRRVRTKTTDEGSHDIGFWLGRDPRGGGDGGGLCVCLCWMHANDRSAV